MKLSFHPKQLRVALGAVFAALVFFKCLTPEASVVLVSAIVAVAALVVPDVDDSAPIPPLEGPPDAKS